MEGVYNFTDVDILFNQLDFLPHPSGEVRQATAENLTLSLQLLGIIAEQDLSMGGSH